MQRTFRDKTPKSKPRNTITLPSFDLSSSGTKDSSNGFNFKLSTGSAIFSASNNKDKPTSNANSVFGTPTTGSIFATSKSGSGTPSTGNEQTSFLNKNNNSIIGSPQFEVVTSSNDEPFKPFSFGRVDQSQPPSQKPTFSANLSSNSRNANETEAYSTNNDSNKEEKSNNCDQSQPCSKSAVEKDSGPIFGSPENLKNGLKPTENKETQNFSFDFKMTQTQPFQVQISNTSPMILKKMDASTSTTPISFTLGFSPKKADASTSTDADEETKNSKQVTIKYQPSVITDESTQKSGLIHCLTALNEVESKSLEELRLENYMANKNVSKKITTHGFPMIIPTHKKNNGFNCKPDHVTKDNIFGLETSSAFVPVVSNADLTNVKKNNGFEIPGQENTLTESQSSPFNQSTPDLRSPMDEHSPTNKIEGVKYFPTPSVDTFTSPFGVTEQKNVVQHCICVMKEYTDKSMEEIRYSDYLGSGQFKHAENSNSNFKDLLAQTSKINGREKGPFVSNNTFKNELGPNNVWTQNETFNPFGIQKISTSDGKNSENTENTTTINIYAQNGSNINIDTPGKNTVVQPTVSTETSDQLKNTDKSFSNPTSSRNNKNCLTTATFEVTIAAGTNIINGTLENVHIQNIVQIKENETKSFEQQQLQEFLIHKLSTQSYGLNVTLPYSTTFQSTTNSSLFKNYLTQNIINTKHANEKATIRPHCCIISKPKLEDIQKRAKAAALTYNQKIPKFPVLFGNPTFSLSDQKRCSGKLEKSSSPYVIQMPFKHSHSERPSTENNSTTFSPAGLFSSPQLGGSNKTCFGNNVKISESNAMMNSKATNTSANLFYSTDSNSGTLCVEGVHSNSIQQQFFGVAGTKTFGGSLFSSSESNSVEKLDIDKNSENNIKTTSALQLKGGLFSSQSIIGENSSPTADKKEFSSTNKNEVNKSCIGSVYQTNKGSENNEMKSIKFGTQTSSLSSSKPWTFGDSTNHSMVVHSLDRKQSQADCSFKMKDLFDDLEEIDNDIEETTGEVTNATEKSSKGEKPIKIGLNHQEFSEKTTETSKDKEPTKDEVDQLVSFRQLANVVDKKNLRAEHEPDWSCDRDVLKVLDFIIDNILPERKQKSELEVAEVKDLLIPQLKLLASKKAFEKVKSHSMDAFDENLEEVDGNGSDSDTSSFVKLDGPDTE